MVTNEANFSASTSNAYVEIVLPDILDFCYWTWNVYVVEYLFMNKMARNNNIYHLKMINNFASQVPRFSRTIAKLQWSPKNPLFDSYTEVKHRSRRFRSVCHVPSHRKCVLIFLSFIFRCEIIDNKNLLTYQILLGIGVCFMMTGTLSSFLIKKISPKKIICTLEKFSTHQSLIIWLIRIAFFIWNSFLFSGSWILVSSLTCFAINFLTEFSATVTSFIVFLSCCSCANIVMAVAVNLFPTNYKGMATAFILMCGRLGGFAGSNLVGMLLSSACTSIFYINGGLLISKNDEEIFKLCF